jgi:hypothetical protein
MLVPLYEFVMKLDTYRKHLHRSSQTGYHVEPAATLYAMRVYCSTTKSLEIHMPGSVDQPMPQHNTTSTTWRGTPLDCSTVLLKY